MSSLRFKMPLMIQGIPEGAAAEWEGLHVGLATGFGYGIGTLEKESPRTWDEKLCVWRCDGPFPHDPKKWNRKQNESYMWISRGALIDACKHSQPKRPHILKWLEEGSGKHFHHFRVPEVVAEYLP